MEYALHLPSPRRGVAIPLVAALLGAAAATTGYALIDGNSVSPSKVVIVQPSGSHSNGEPTPMSGHRP
jgi:hypothetical protein